MKKPISSTQPLTPTSVLDITTGEYLGQEWVTPVTQLIEYVRTETTTLYRENTNKLVADLASVTRVGSPNSFGRQRGYKSNYDTLPEPVKAKSRVNELVLHKLVSEVSSWVYNPNPAKQPPSFPSKINLGAVDKQMVTLAVTGDHLTLLWKVWNKELLFEFTLPRYILQRSITKWSLPTVQIEHGAPVFRYSFTEQPTQRATPTLAAGLDMGRVEPYTMVVVTPQGNQTATYTTSGRLKRLNTQRENILVHKRNILRKLDSYEALNPTGTNKNLTRKQEVLVLEKTRLAGKAKRLGHSLALQVGAEVTKKLNKHNLNMLAVENLTWASGARYGSKWNHSKQQEALTHSLARVGISTRRVSPRNTSQSCYKCGATVVHNAKKRSVWCAGCKTSMDRDFNAALNIARKIIPYLNKHSMIEGNSSGVGTPQVTNHGSKSVLGNVTFTT